MIELKHVSKTFDSDSGGVDALKDVSLTIEDGDIYGIIGMSGAGKSTLVRCINLLERPTAGEVVVNGQRLDTMAPAQLRAARREITMIFQRFNLLMQRTCLQNVCFPMELSGVKKADAVRRAKELLELVGLPDKAQAYPAQLSGGQQQRIALARALVFEPELVLMDEPLGALDKQLREHMQFEIKRIADSLGITVVYVTHDQTEALTMSDRVAVFNDGRIQQLAPPAELYESPKNSFVAQFIGENNKLPGTIEAIEGGRALVRLATGELIDATAVNVTQTGQQTLVSIRPERVEFKPELLPAGAHTLEAEVLEFIYMGDQFRTRLRVAGSDDFILKCRNAAGQRVLVPGERIRIGWAPQDARALDPI